MPSKGKTNIKKAPQGITKITSKQSSSRQRPQSIPKAQTYKKGKTYPQLIYHPFVPGGCIS